MRTLYLAEESLPGQYIVPQGMAHLAAVAPTQNDAQPGVYLMSRMVWSSMGGSPIPGRT